MSSLTTQLRRARPRLRVVAPLTWSICWGYVVVNLLIGVGLYLTYRPSSQILIINNVFTYQVWGIIFIALSLAKAYGLVTNRWSLVKNMLISGLLVKAFWLAALIQRSIVDPRTMLITAIWLFFAYIQAVTYVYFTPAVLISSTNP